MRAALAAARGDFVTVLGADGVLAPSALFKLATNIVDQPTADLLYTDEDRLRSNGTRCDPDFKPDWSPDTLLGANYIGDLCVVRRSLVERAGGIRPEFGAGAIYDLVLRCAEHAEGVVHLPRVLYHRRVPLSPDTTHECRALQDHLHRTGVAGSVVPGSAPGGYRVTRHLGAQPRVSVLIPNRDQAELLRTCVESIFRSTYSNFEILIVENGSQRPTTFALYDELVRRGRVRVLKWTRAFNYSAVNNFAAQHANGEMLLLLNNDMQVINPDWLERMVEHALVPEVGAVGAKLYYSTGTIQHAGVASRCRTVTPLTPR